MLVIGEEQLRSLCRTCEDGFQTVLGRSCFVRFRLPRRRRGFPCTVHLQSAKPPEGGVPLVEILTEEDRVFLAEVSVQFVPHTRGWQFADAQIAVFHRLMTAEPLVPLFRAEWHSYGNDPGPPHAQPHWHILGTMPLTDNDEVASWGRAGHAETRDVNFTPQTPGERRPPHLGRVHFAMASAWHLRNGHSAELSADGLAHWLAGCLGYVRQQLQLC